MRDPSAPLAALIARELGPDHRLLSAERRPLRGGLVAGAVLLVTARCADARGRPRLLRFVEKHLAGAAARETALYARLLAPRGVRVAPRLLGVEEDGDGVVLFLEAVARVRAWPWRDTAQAAKVVRAAALVHALPVDGREIPPWDYEAELSASAERTVEALERTGGGALLPDHARLLGTVRRAAERIAPMRRQLAAGPLPPALLHGDLHSGNAILTGSGRVVLVDWGRARVGSPLEDVASWLQSLARWEPEVRRRHDTLLGAYLAARGLAATPTRGVRDAYWLGAGMNAFAGALRYHLEVARSREVPDRTRAEAVASARDWIRVIRRAAEVWGCDPERRPAGVRDRRNGRRASSPVPSPAP